MASLPPKQRGFTIKGVPLVLIEYFTDSRLIARIEKAEKVVLKTSYPSNSIYGGNGLYPIDYMDGDRVSTLEIVTPRFQYGLTEAAMGATVTTGTNVSMQVIGEKAIVPATTTYTVELKNRATAVKDSVKVYYADTDVLLTQDTTPASGKYSFADGVLTFVAADARKELVIDYQYTSTTGDLIEVLANGKIPVVKVTLANEFNNQDGVLTREAIFVHKCKASGDMEHDENRANPAKHTLTFNLMDPERVDGQLYSHGYIAVSSS